MSIDDIIHVSGNQTLTYKGKQYTCALGKGGLTQHKKEGDGATPIGCYPLRKVYYRPDRMSRPNTPLDISEITAQHGWCDDPARAEYNQFVTLPFNGSHEQLYREDHIYDIIVVLGHNDDPPIPSQGSAIFFHLARDGYKPTEGCVALSLVDMCEVLKQITPQTLIEIRD